MAVHNDLSSFIVGHELSIFEDLSDFFGDGLETSLVLGALGRRLVLHSTLAVGAATPPIPGAGVQTVVIWCHHLLVLRIPISMITNKSQDASCMAWRGPHMTTIINLGTYLVTRFYLFGVLYLAALLNNLVGVYIICAFGLNLWS